MWPVPPQKYRGKSLCLSLQISEPIGKMHIQVRGSQTSTGPIGTTMKFTTLSSRAVRPLRITYRITAFATTARWESGASCAGPYSSRSSVGLENAYRRIYIIRMACHSRASCLPCQSCSTYPRRRKPVVIRIAGTMQIHVIHACRKHTDQANIAHVT